MIVLMSLPVLPLQRRPCRRSLSSESNSSGSGKGLLTICQKVANISVGINEKETHEKKKVRRLPCHKFQVHYQQEKGRNRAP
jgi:hypothetical protein